MINARLFANAYDSDPFPWHIKYDLPKDSLKRIERWKKEFADELQSYNQNEILHRIEKENNNIASAKKNKLYIAPQLLYPTNPEDLTLEKIHSIGSWYFAENSQKAFHDRFKFALLLENFEGRGVEMVEGKHFPSETSTVATAEEKYSRTQNIFPRKLFQAAIQQNSYIEENAIENDEPNEAQILWEKLIAFYLALPDACGDIAESIDKFFENGFKATIPEGKVVKVKPAGEGTAYATPADVTMQFKSLLAEVFVETPQLANRNR